VPGAPGPGDRTTPALTRHPSLSKEGNSYPIDFLKDHPQANSARDPQAAPPRSGNWLKI
jgi:hypothetical protein